MRFCTVINCMDGRIQLPVIRYLQTRFNCEFVDNVTEPGPNRLLAEQQNQMVIESILQRVRISVEKHGSTQIAVVGHHDCAGNPVSKEEQWQHIKKAVQFVANQFPNAEVIGLWVNEQWEVQTLE